MVTDIDGVDRRLALKLFATVFLLSAFFFKPQLDFSRFEFLTKALAHHRTIAIDEVMRETGVDIKDKVTAGGRTFIAVTPGLSFLGLITYCPYAWFVAPRLGALPPDLEMKLTQYAMAIGTVMPAAAAALATFFLFLRRLEVDRRRSVLFSGVFYAGTPVLFYSLNLTNGQNIIEMALVLISLFLLAGSARAEDFRLTKTDREAGATKMIAVGLLQGLACFINMPAALVLPPVAVHLWLERRSALGWWIAGLVPGLLGLEAYNWTAFGGELSVYHIIYRGWVPLVSLLGSWTTALELLVGWRIGLLFFCPVVALLAFVRWRTLLAETGPRMIVAGTILYVVAWSLMLQIFKVQQTGEHWLQSTGGGGPRYLLPILPVLLLGATLADLTSARRRTLAAVLILASVIVNMPGLFWTGGTPWVLNNLILFLKNGFHSYTIDMVRDILVLKGMNVAGFGMRPGLSAMILLIWWIWSGHRRCVEFLKGGAS